MSAIQQHLTAAEAVRAIRGDMSQTAFARKCGLSQPFVSQLEAGVRDLTKSTALGIELACGEEPMSLVRLSKDAPATLLGLVKPAIPGSRSRLSAIAAIRSLSSVSPALSAAAA